MRRVIFIDDDPALRDAVCLQLGFAGLRVDAYADAADGLRAILLAQPDLVLLDLMLPGFSGLEVLHALKGDPATRLIPVLVLSGRADAAAHAEVMRLGAAGFLNKPLTSRLLLEGVLGELVAQDCLPVSALRDAMRRLDEVQALPWAVAPDARGSRRASA